jgi:prolipoprotein diacylglyceryltransferase
MVLVAGWRGGWWHLALHSAPGLSSMAGRGFRRSPSSRRRSISRRALCDAIAPAALVGFAIGRVGCFCRVLLRRPTTLAWGVLSTRSGAGASPCNSARRLDLVAAGWAGVGAAPA